MRDLFSRRDLLRTASAAFLGSLLPPALWAGGISRIVRSDRALVLVELEGGNDGLNTIVPTFQKAIYDAQRPSLRLRQATATAFNYQQDFIPFTGEGGFTGGASGLVGDQSGLGIHAAMNRLMPAWRAGDMAVALGVGYANPNRSHFRGIDIWNSGATDNQPLVPSGWLGRMFTAEGLDAASKTNGMLFSRANFTPLVNSSSKAIAMDSPEDFISSSAFLVGENLDDDNPWNDVPALVTSAPTPTGSAALDRILNARWQVVEARTSVIDAMAATASGPLAAQLDQFPDTDLGNQARSVFRCIAGGLNCPLYKIAIGGFDNHTGQKGKHADLLAEVANALAALRTALIAAGKWDSTLVMTYSEFGRRVEENGSGGTDHGTAAPHFFLGGGVNGGTYGTQPSIAEGDLDQQWDMIATMDFRRLYATCGDWLGVATANQDPGLDPFNVGLTFSAIDGLLAS